MEQYGFMRVAAVSPRVYLANPQKNAEEIIKLAGDAFRKEAAIVVFPELCITGYSCGDLFAQDALLKGAEDAMRQILKATKGYKSLLAVGAPIQFRSGLYNCAILLKEGRILGIVPKTAPSFRPHLLYRAWRPELPLLPEQESPALMVEQSVSGVWAHSVVQVPSRLF
jgi:NAD+ synthase (glutamine-hydrolysing)